MKNWQQFKELNNTLILSPDQRLNNARFNCDQETSFADLQVPVLARYPQTTSGMLLVNFDPYIFEVIKESEYMLKLNLEIPEAAKVLVHSKDKLKAHFSQMKVWHLYDFLMYTNKFGYKIKRFVLL